MRAVAVIGCSSCDEKKEILAYQVGQRLAKNSIALICGGMGGVMKAAARGVKSMDGISVGIIPGYDKSEANEYLDIIIPTGMNQARNVIVVSSADAVIAIGGGYGTLSEIAHALKLGKPVITLESWNLKELNVIEAKNPEHAVELALNFIQTSL